MRKVMSLFAVLVAAASTTMVPDRAVASLVLAMDLPTLVERSEHVAVADVTSVRSAWDSRHEQIETTIELEVVESWKGPMAPASRVTIIQPGGTVGDVTMVVFGMSRFTPGERSLLFLRGPVTAAGVVGMSQGKRLVRREGVGKRWMVDAPVNNGARLVRPTGRALSTAPVTVTTRSLDELREEIRGLLKAPQR